MSQLEQDLAFVRSVVEDNRKALRVDAWPLLVWGLLSVFGVVLAYLAPVVDSIWLWLVIVGLAWILTGTRVLTSGRRHPANLSERALSMLWFGLLTAMTVIGFVGTFTQSLPPAAITPSVAALFGAGYLASAVLLDWRVLKWFALAWWAGSITLFLLLAPVRLAVFGGLLLVLLVVPVIILMRSSRTQ